MKKIFKKKGILVAFIFIVLTAFIFRTYSLSSNPPGIHIDELAFAYNAYSILYTGKDEYGQFLPIILRSFDDYRTGLFSYLAMPFIKILGLNILSVRLVSVILSVITLFALYNITLLFLKISTDKRRISKTDKQEKIIALCSIFLYSISPWSIFLSRIAIDTNVGLTFITVGLWMFLKYIYSKTVWYLFSSIIFFAITFYSYNGIKVFLPLFLIALLITFYRELFSRKKEIIIGGILFMCMVFPSINVLQDSTNLSRFSTLSFFSSIQTDVLSTSSLRLEHSSNNVLGKLFDNRRVTLIPRFITNYLTNLSLSWLYADDYTHDKYKVPDFGLFYLFELPLLILGLYFIAKRHLFITKIFAFFIVWILLSIIPAAITIDTPSAVRIYTALPAFLIIESCGLYFLFKFIQQQTGLIKIFLYSSTSMYILISVLWFSHAYFITFPYQQSHTYAYGIPEALEYAKKHENDYRQILISNRGIMTFSYMHYLFNSKYDPKKYLDNGGTQSGNFFANHVIEKYLFLNPNIYENINGTLQYNPEFLKRDILYIVDANVDIPPDTEMQKKLFKEITILKKIKYINGQNAIFIFTAQKRKTDISN